MMVRFRPIVVIKLATGRPSSGHLKARDADPRELTIFAIGAGSCCQPTSSDT